MSWQRVFSALRQWFGIRGGQPALAPVQRPAPPRSGNWGRRSLLGLITVGFATAATAQVPFPTSMPAPTAAGGPRSANTIAPARPSAVQQNVNLGAPQRAPSPVPAPEVGMYVDPRRPAFVAARCGSGVATIPGPAAPHCIHGVDAACAGSCGEATWAQFGAVPWQAYGPGEYTGHAREEHVPEYRLRVDDLLELVYRLTREETGRPYTLNVGDEIRVESVADPTLDRQLIVQPDGSVTLKLVGQVRATRRTVEQLREEIESQYRTYYREPAITITPIKVNTKLEDLRQSVNSQYGQGGQVRQARVTPEGTIALPVVGSVYVQGLTLGELAEELGSRYSEEIDGIEVTPVLLHRAPRYVFVLGEVKQPGRFTLEGPTTAMQAVALAGSWSVGANLRQVVVFRRGDDWRLLATMLDLRGALYGKRPGPADEIWLNDLDIVLVPKGPLKVTNEAIEQIFSRGIYGVMPFGWSYSFNNFGTVR